MDQSYLMELAKAGYDAANDWNPAHHTDSWNGLGEKQKERWAEITKAILEKQREMPQYSQDVTELRRVSAPDDRGGGLALRYRRVGLMNQSLRITPEEWEVLALQRFPTTGMEACAYCGENPELLKYSADHFTLPFSQTRLTFHGPVCQENYWAEMDVIYRNWLAERRPQAIAWLYDQIGLEAAAAALQVRSEGHNAESMRTRLEMILHNAESIRKLGLEIEERQRSGPQPQR